MSTQLIKLKLRLIFGKFTAVLMLMTKHTLNKNVAQALKLVGHGNNRFLIWFTTYRHYESLAAAKIYTKFPLTVSKSVLADFVDNNIIIKQPEYWANIKNHNGPIIFVAPHYGTFATACLKAIIDMENIKKIYTFYNAPTDTPTNAQYSDILGCVSDNFEAIFNDRRGLVKALRVLKNNQILTMMPDVAVLAGNSIMTPLLGRYAMAMEGTAFMALKTQAMIIQVYCRPSSLGKIECILEAPYIVKPTLDFEQDVFELTAKMFKSLEQMLKTAPEHWLYLSDLPARLGISLLHDNNAVLNFASTIGLDKTQLEKFLSQTTNSLNTKH